jgi:Phosphodiester glycosidase
VAVGDVPDFSGRWRLRITNPGAICVVAIGLDATMRKIFQLLSLLLFCSPAVGALVTVGSWTPIFKGVELTSGQQQAQLSGEANHQVLCLRVDLTDPDIQLFTTPHCTNSSCTLETLSENPSYFLEQYGLQVAVNGGFYTSSAGGADSALGTPEDVFGLAISQGTVVSPADDPSFVAVLLFNSNNVPVFVPTNSPATNTTGIYTAIAGNHALLFNGVNLRSATPNDLDPRTALGLSQDRRYLFLMTIDGRQSGWSDGADFHDTGEWLKRFGATDGINGDGGGSTTMVMANCVGGAVRLNRSSYVAAYGRERNTGHNFGVRAIALPSDLKNLRVEPGTRTASFTWNTEVPATTQVQYGLTTNYGSATPLDARLVRSHVATLAGLTRGTNYYYRAISAASGQSLTQACQFSTITSLVTTQLFGLTQVWTYTTNNLDGVNWTAPTYGDTNWLGEGPGLLYVENASYVDPKNTALPPPYGQTIPRTYYFRTHFSCTDGLTGGSLTLSNYVDDGAVFYLNGAELYRLRMPAAPTQILNSTLANASPCTGTAYSGDAATICPDVFTVSGDVLTNLVSGDNVLAVEVHNYAVGSLDIVFGSALIPHIPVFVPPLLNLWVEDDVATLFWNAEGFTLQHASTLAGSGDWSDVPGPVTQSPLVVTNPAAGFYRLRQ